MQTRHGKPRRGTLGRTGRASPGQLSGTLQAMGRAPLEPKPRRELGLSLIKIQHCLAQANTRCSQLGSFRVLAALLGNLRCVFERRTSWT